MITRRRFFGGVLGAIAVLKSSLSAAQPERGAGRSVVGPVNPTPAATTCATCGEAIVHDGTFHGSSVQRATGELHHADCFERFVSCATCGEPLVWDLSAGTYVRGRVLSHGEQHHRDCFERRERERSGHAIAMRERSRLPDPWDPRDPWNASPIDVPPELEAVVRERDYLNRYIANYYARQPARPIVVMCTCADPMTCDHAYPTLLPPVPRSPSMAEYLAMMAPYAPGRTR
jgi:hypothetical protein